MLRFEPDCHERDTIAIKIVHFGLSIGTVGLAAVAVDGYRVVPVPCSCDASDPECKLARQNP